MSEVMSEVIHVKLPDGSTKEVPKGATALDVAKSISPRLADAALAAKTNGNLIDLTSPLEQDTDLKILTEFSAMVELRKQCWRPEKRVKFAISVSPGTKIHSFTSGCLRWLRAMNFISTRCRCP